MPKLQRRSNSHQLSRKSSVNQNTLNFSSDGDNNSRRNSEWWKNLTDTRRNSILTNSQIHPDSYKILNEDSIIAGGQNSQWWRHLSENENIPSPNKVNITSEKADKSTEDRTEKNLSQSESDENENIFPRKSLFVSQEQHSRKTRYSNAFNLNVIKSNEEDQNNAQKEDNNFEIDEFQNKFEDNKNTESPSPTVPKGNKKRKTKSIFSKKLGKRKFSDAFTETNKEPDATGDNKNKTLETEDSAAENVSISKEPKEGLFKLDLKKKRYSEAFLLNSESPGPTAPKGNKKRKTKSIFSKKLGKRKFSDAFTVTDNEPATTGDNKNKTLETEDSAAENVSISKEPKEGLFKLDRKEAAEKSINVTKEMKKTLFKRETKGKKYSEPFLGPSGSKIIQDEIWSQSEKENDDHESHQVSSQHVKESLFKLQNKSQKYSQTFDLDEDNKENNQNEIIITDENAAKLKNKNIKPSQAYMELINIQKEIEEERANTAKQINTENKYLEVHTNKSINEIMEKEIETDDTKFTSISSIDISADIKHPLFRPKARKSLYSSKSATKIEQLNINSQQEQQQNLEKIQTGRISSKRFSLRSTSPAESGISKFFEESLISSTKLFINANEEGSGGSEKKKRGRPPKSSSVVNENPDELENDVLKSCENKDVEFDTEKNTSSKPKRGRSKPKLLTIVPQNLDNALNNEIIHDNNNSGLEKVVQNKNLSNRNRKSKSDIIILENQDVPLDNEENNDIEPEEPIKNKHSSSTTERKSKSKVSVPVDPENNESEKEDNQDSKTDAFVKNKSLNSSRKSKSVSRIHEESKSSESNKIVKNKKRSRSPKSTSTVTENIQIEKEIISNDKRNTAVQEYAQNKKIPNNVDSEPVSSSGRKSKVISSILEDFESSASEIEMPKNSKTTIPNEIIKKKKRGRPRKSTLIISENIANTSEKESSVATRMKKSLIRTVENEIEENKNSESEAQVRKESSRTRKSSVASRENSVVDLPKDIREDENDVFDKLKKQKNIISKIPRKMNSLTDRITPEKNITAALEVVMKRKSSFINKTRESSKENVKIIDSSASENNVILGSSDLDNSLNHKKYYELPIEKLVLKQAAKISTSNQYQSSKFTKEINDDCEDSLSNIITINSSTSKARPSQFSNVNKNVENWLTKSFVESTQTIAENKNTGEFLSSLNLEPVGRKSKKLFRWRQKSKAEQISTEDELKRQDLLLKAVNDIQEKQNKSPPKIPVKKITDYFNKLNKNEKLKPIPKGTNNAKKIPRPVCTARLINGKPYYSKKLFRGRYWCTPRFYKYLQNKMGDEYGEDTINESEKIMKYIVNSVQVVIKSKKYVKNEVDNLKKELARHKIILTTYDFFCFCADFLPTEYRDLVVPITRTYTTEPSVPCDEKDIFKQIQY